MAIALFRTLPVAMSNLDIVPIERKSDLGTCNIQDLEMAHAQRKLRKSIQQSECIKPLINHLKAIRLNFMNELVTCGFMLFASIGTLDCSLAFR